jgi:3-phytase
VRTGRPSGQYRYRTDPVAEPPVPAGGLAINGLVELYAADRRTLLALERSFSVGAGNSVKLYRASLRPGGPATKRLLLDFDRLGRRLDNLEGMTFGPRRPDGRRTLIVVGDNNFSPTQVTQVLVFAVGTTS